MAENFHDTAASFDQNEAYLKDPISSESKPYSTKQQAANQAHGHKTWLYHKVIGGKVFDNNAIDAAFEKVWQHEPFEHPNAPGVTAETPEATETDEVKLLRDELERAGVVVDKRWGVKRLREELTKTSG